MCGSFKPTKMHIVSMSELLLTPSELRGRCIYDGFPLDFIGTVQWDFNSRLGISNLKYS